MEPIITIIVLGAIVRLIVNGTGAPPRRRPPSKIVSIRPLNQKGGPPLPSEILAQEAAKRGLSLTSERCPACGLESFSLEGMPAIDVDATEVSDVRALPEHVISQHPNE